MAVSAPCDWSGLKPCLAFMHRVMAPTQTGATIRPPTAKATPPTFITCGDCGQCVEEFARGSAGEFLCRPCLRCKDEALFGSLAAEERHGLDLVAGVLDTVSWKYWKPGEQPAKLLDWLFLGDLQEAMDFNLLASRGINAVLNVINWWELGARVPNVTDMPSLYWEHGMEFESVDSEDRLFFNIVEESWPAAEAFLDRCQRDGHRVIVNCKAGHNRSACVCICWLVVREGMSLIDAVRLVQQRRGAILSNHGFRLQLVRLALRLGRLGEAAKGAQWVHATSSDECEDKLGSIITKKRLRVKYDRNSKDYSGVDQKHVPTSRNGSLISKEVIAFMSNKANKTLSQHSLKMELLACLFHRGKNFRSMYEYTSSPPTVIGSGFSGDVVLCRRREKAAVSQNIETAIRCVKTFNLQEMGPEKLEKLKNEASIYLSLEHPHIARLFDVFEDNNEVALVMQYCSGGTLEQVLQNRGAFGEKDFQHVAVPMLLAVNYIHRQDITHRDIKPRNWVYEADGVTVKLIDFGFSVKQYLSDDGTGDGGGLQGCLGTLGYLAPEVVKAGLSTDAGYSAKCDIWSLGAVFFELLSGQPAFHRDGGMCDGYTEEVVLRDIKEVTDQIVDALLNDIPLDAAPFLRRLLTQDPAARPCAQEALHDPYLQRARDALAWSPRALPVATVLDRFRAHRRASKTSRAWLQAVARSPTHLPWKEFCTLRDTFKMFDALEGTGSVGIKAFVCVVTAATFGEEEDPSGRHTEEEEAYWSQYEVVTGACQHVSGRVDPVDARRVSEAEVRRIWEGVCGGQESLSYCEFLAVLLPPIEDVFEDVGDTSPSHSSKSMVVSPSMWRACGWPSAEWDPSQPMSRFLPLLEARARHGKVPVFAEATRVAEVVRAMNETHHRWVIVRYSNGRHAFFDYMDINHKLVKMSGRKAGSSSRPNLSHVMARLSSTAVGAIANCSGHAAFVPVVAETPLCEILRLISGRDGHSETVRRVPIVDQNGELICVFSCLDFLTLALIFDRPAAVLKSRAARTFDRRDTILQVSVLHDEAMLNALRIMDSEHLTICPATSLQLSGDMGGVVAINVVSVADLKWVIGQENYDILNTSVDDFVAWRASVANAHLDQIIRQQRLSRFNVIYVSADDSLHTMAQRLLASKLQRIFLASDELARIVGSVGSRDILVETIDQML
mmetsp:Transcript_78687/g.218542  ORF Transcript_78687/g.218542 Transcript_78687/m.218542 type:complete len:1178 (-) Transcript_78687:74-3607(-)